MTALIHDPYVDMTPSQLWAASQRVARARRMRPAAPVAARVAPDTDYSVPDYRCMWFYDLVFTSEKLLPLVLAPMRPRDIRIDEIQQACAAHYEVRQADMVSARRTGELTRPRHVAYFLSKQLTPYSMPRIGRNFGGRDHTTILYGVRKIERQRKADPVLDAEIRAIAATLGASA